MKSTYEEPLSFFFNLTEQFDVYVEERFYTDYQSQLMVSGVDKEKGIIYHYERDEKGEIIPYKEYLSDFLKRSVNREIIQSKELIKSNIRNPSISDNKNSNVFFKRIHTDLIDLFDKSQNFVPFDLRQHLLDLNNHLFLKYRLYIEFENTLPSNAYQIERPLSVKENVFILSFEWIKPEPLLSELYDKLSNAELPLIECEYSTFKKAFTKGILNVDEGIKWLCYSEKNKKDISQVSLIRFIKLLINKEYLSDKDDGDFNKIIKNIFLKPNGDRLTNIKGSKSSKSENSARFTEIKGIVDSLTSIA